MGSIPIGGSKPVSYFTVKVQRTTKFPNESADAKDRQNRFALSVVTATVSEVLISSNLSGEGSQVVCHPTTQHKIVYGIPAKKFRTICKF